jgi:hypothetical protein
MIAIIRYNQVLYHEYMKNEGVKTPSLFALLSSIHPITHPSIQGAGAQGAYTNWIAYSEYPFLKPPENRA